MCILGGYFENKADNLLEHRVTAYKICVGRFEAAESLCI